MTKIVNKRNLFLIIFFTIGFVLLCYGAVQFFDLYKFQKNSLTTTGLVTGMVYKETRRGLIGFPQVAFTDNAGGSRQFDSYIGSGSGESNRYHYIGDNVIVRYQKENPNDAIINDRAIYVFPGVATLFGLIIISTGVFLKLKTPSRSIL